MTDDRRLPAADRAALLGIARRALLRHFGATGEVPLPRDGPLAEPRGAFVSLHVEGDLRGCIGTFQPRGSLAETVARMAVSAATDDPRFLALRPDELGGLRIAISVRGWNRGALLPKVAVEHGWDAPEFLKHACLKAGLPPSAADEPETVVEVFEAEEFEE
jgi:AMMECR1 domain-containing protein